MSYHGKFVPMNKEKYRGNWDKITYRSSWEKYCMELFDRNPEIIRWSSEEVIIPYFSEADGKQRRYFMDFYVKFKNGDEYLFEVKPDKETKKPVAPSTMTVAAKKRFMNEIYTYSVNVSKWKAAHKLCLKKGWGFKIVTENTLRSWGWKGGKA